MRNDLLGYGFQVLCDTGWDNPEDRDEERIIRDTARKALRGSLGRSLEKLSFAYYCLWEWFDEETAEDYLRKYGGWYLRQQGAAF